ncbi:MAG: phytanoyl-CoA dioxygenase family protein [Acidimicrobiales bacterium]
MSVETTLSDQQVEEYRRQGWIVIPNVFSADEVEMLGTAATEVLERPGPEVGREDDGAPSICWGMHLFDERLGALTRHPAIVEPARQLLDNDVFVHQSRINMKQTNGSIVAWHQDFGTYHRVDGVPEPRGIMIAVFVDDVSITNAPLLAVPGSHTEGLVSTAQVDPDSPDHETVSKYRYDITEEKMADLVDRHGLEAITAPAGSVLLMDMTVVHGSSINISPQRRLVLYINVCPVDNRGESYERPEYYAARDFSALQALDADCLSQFVST